MASLRKGPGRVGPSPDSPEELSQRRIKPSGDADRVIERWPPVAVFDGAQHRSRRVTDVGRHRLLIKTALDAKPAHARTKALLCVAIESRGRLHCPSQCVVHERRFTLRRGGVKPISAGATDAAR